MMTNSCSAANEELWGICVKNTFIDVAAPIAEQPRRNGSSVPPSLRLARGEEGPLSGEKRKDAEADTLSDQEDASTDAGNSSVEVDSQVDAAESVLTVAALPFLHSGGQSFRVSSPVSSCTESPVEGPPRPRARLNTRARAYAPVAGASAATMDTPQARYFKQELERFVAAAKAALVSCIYITGVQVADDEARGLSVAVSIGPRHCQYRESVLSKVKQALLESATTSQGVVLLGYGARPFLPMPDGFMATFCLVPEKQAACWGLLKKGTCQYGACCRWQHPVFQAAVSVKILLEDQPSP